MAGVSLSNAASTGPAVAGGVRSLLPVRVIAASPSSAPTLGLGCKFVMEGFDLVGEGSVGGGKGGVGGNEFLVDSLLVGGSYGKVVQGIVDGVQEASIIFVEWAE